MSCQLGNLASGGTATTTIVASYKGKGNGDNTVSVASSTPDPVTTNNTVRTTFRLQ